MNNNINNINININGAENMSSNSSNGNGIVVCVTGASGYIASWIVKLLLLRGYTVHATVRDTNDQTKTKHLKALEGAKERLHLFKADLMEEGSFDYAISGCHGVFHTASPVHFHDIKNPQVEMLDPAIKGTLSILNACKKCPTVRRVVLTSSMGAVVYNGRYKGPEVVVDETWFSDPDFFKQSKGFWYLLSKTSAEKAAWKYAQENGMDMVSINPGSVTGPMLQPTVCESVATIFNLINGEKTYRNVALPWVNVKDVGMAHILAFELPSASGRYCLVESVVHESQLVDMLRQIYPTLSLPDKCADDKPLAPTYQVSKERVKSLGMEYIPLKASLKETIEDLKERGFINF